MAFSRRFGGFVPIASLVTTLTTGFILKDWLVGRPVLILPVALGLFVASYVVLWCAAIFALRFFHREEFRHRLAAAWRERFEAAASQHQITRSITDYMDRVIQIQMSIALPNVLDAAHLSVMSSDLRRLKQLEQERDALRKDSELAGNVLLLADRWRSYEVVTSRTRRVIDDPIHGCIDLDDKLATVLAHPLLQRLNRVRRAFVQLHPIPFLHAFSAIALTGRGKERRAGIIRNTR